jgi:hypothetical protein
VPPPDLPPDTRRKLVATLGMLGSSHVGERDNAAQLATRMVRSAGLTWEALVAVPRLEARSEPPRPRPAPSPPDWRELALRCGAHPRWLSDWERTFAGLPRWACLSSKQAATLDRIALKLRSRGVAV